MEVRYRKRDKTLLITSSDPAWCTPFEPGSICEVLNAVYKLTRGRDYSFQFSKENGFVTYSAKMTEKEIKEWEKDNG
jgi:hypothetical protein